VPSLVPVAVSFKIELVPTQLSRKQRPVEWCNSGGAAPA
jgi:hypothetical protein